MLFLLILLQNLAFCSDETSLVYTDYAYGASGNAQLLVLDSSFTTDWHEVEAWKSNGTTKQNGEACGVPFEGFFIVGRKKNHVVLKIKNQSDSKIIVNPREIHLSIQNEYDANLFAEKALGQVLNIAPNSNLSFFIPIPSKFMLMKSEYISASVPFKFEGDDSKNDCVSKVEFRRSTQPIIKTVTEYNAAEFRLAFGGNLFKTGDLAKAGHGVGFAFDWIMYYLFHPSHGVFLSASSDNGYGRGDYNTLRPITGFSNNEYPELRSSTSSAGYTYRKYIDPRFRGQYDLGFGETTFFHKNADGGLKRHYAFSIEERFGIDYRFSKIDIDTSAIHYIGLILQHRWQPWGSMDSVRVAGNSFSVLASYTFGFL